VLGVPHGRAHLRELLDGVADLLVEDAPIRDDDDRVEDPFIVFGQADELVREPGDGVAALKEAGVEIIPVETDAVGRLDIALVLKALATRGITRLLAEGGASVAASLLRAKLLDRLVCYQAPMVIGGDGRPAIDDLLLDHLKDAPTFERNASETLASDLGATYITGKA
jgi:riboflavin biosynthesis pyrimidine reductase